MLKRFLACLIVCLILILTLVFPLAASADVVWSNNFLEKNRDKMIDLDRNRFVINSDSGGLVPKEAPESNSDAYDYNGAQLNSSFENGKTIYLNKVYEHKGEYWGIDDYMDWHGGPTGWFPMDQLLVLYDRRDFNEDFIDEFYSYTDYYSVDTIEDILVDWQWPGSDFAKVIYYISDDDYVGWNDISLINIDVLYAYKDADEREWGFVEVEAILPYASGGGLVELQTTVQQRDMWICLSDPSNLDIPAFNPAPEPTKWSPPSETIESNRTDNVDPEIVPPVDNSPPTNIFTNGISLLFGISYIIPIVIVVIIILISVWLLVYIIYRKSSSKNKEQNEESE